VTETQEEAVIDPPSAVAQEVASPPKAPLRSDYNTQKDYERAAEEFFNFEIIFEPTPPKERVVEIIDQISGIDRYIARGSASKDEREAVIDSPEAQETTGRPKPPLRSCFTGHREYNRAANNFLDLKKTHWDACLNKRFVREMFSHASSFFVFSV